MTEPAPALRTSCRDIMRLAAPLMLSMSAQVAMQFTDALFLARLSEAAIAAVGPAGMAVWVALSLFTGAAGYTAVFVSQYVGAGRPDRIAPVVWQGLWFSFAVGGLIALTALIRGPLFDAVGHAPEVRALEKTYFGICALGAPLVLGSAALGGYFSGRHRTGLLMTAQVSGLALNALLDWLLIFGKAGFPALGMAGAAWATVIAHALVFATLAGLFLGPRARRELNTWRRRGLDGELLARLLRFGLPQGARYTIEAVAWTLFVMVVGRIGTVELASTNIAWRINGIAFFPVIGLSQAVAILVGNAQGARRPDLAARAMWRGILLTQIWMVSGAVLFVVFPRELYGLFRGADGMGADGFARVAVLGVVLLRYVAAYCLLDGMNVLLVGALQAAGDTHWTMVVSLLLHALFTALVLAGDALGASLNDQWLLATVFVLIQALVWLARFHEGRWRDMRVIESEDPVTP